MKLEHVVRQVRGSIVDWMAGKEEYKGINGQIKAIWRARVILTIVALSSIPCLVLTFSLIFSDSPSIGWVATLGLSWFGVPLVLGGWLVRKDEGLLVNVFPTFLARAPHGFKEKEVGPLLESMNSKGQMIYSKKYRSTGAFKATLVVSALVYLPLIVAIVVVFAIDSWLLMGVSMALVSLAFILMMNLMFYYTNFERCFIFDAIVSFGLGMFLGVGVMRIQDYVSLEGFSIVPVVAYGFLFYGIRNWARKKAEADIIPRLAGDLARYFETEDVLELRYWAWHVSNSRLVKKAIEQGHLDYLEVKPAEIAKKAAGK